MLMLYKPHILGGVPLNALESVIIIPIILVIILFIFSLFSFATQLNLDEMNFSRYFLMNTLEDASINTLTTKNEYPVIHRDWLFYQINILENTSTINNQFTLPSREDFFNNKGDWHIVRYNRTFLALANEASQIFLREDSKE